MRTPELQNKPKTGRRVKRLERYKCCHCFLCVGETFPRGRAKGRAKDRLRREVEEEW